jgi:hypothetical protein
MSSSHSMDSRPVGTRRRLRSGALAIASLMLVTACATGSASAGRLAADGNHEGNREGEAVFATLPTDFAPVRVSDSEFTAAVTTLWLTVPLRVASSSPPLYVGRKLALASSPLSGEAWQSDLARSYGQYCERCGTPGDCLTLFEDGPHLQADDRRSIALALAVGPALDGVNAEVRGILNPTRVLATLSIGITAYMALLVAPVPEPVTKSIAAAFTVLMWGYLGWEFFDLLRAYAQLYEDAPHASTFAELREIGERFGKVIGPNSVRILVMVGTAAVGEMTALASKAPKLPGFEQASRAVEVKAGMRLMEAVTGAERVIVSVPQGAIRLVLAPHVIAMAAQTVASGSAAPARGRLLPNGHRAWGSYSGFKSAMGSAGNGNEWHHIVEQTPGNVKRFGGGALHNTENVIRFGKALHSRVSALYSSIRVDITGSATLTVRKWLGSQSYEEQFAFGLRAMTNVRNGVW